EMMRKKRWKRLRLRMERFFSEKFFQEIWLMPSRPYATNTPLGANSECNRRVSVRQGMGKRAKSPGKSARYVVDKRRTLRPKRPVDAVLHGTPGKRRPSRIRLRG